jgi:hypothetical protein
LRKEGTMISEEEKMIIIMSTPTADLNEQRRIKERRKEVKLRGKEDFSL